MFYIIAILMFALYAFGVDPESFNLGWMGLAVLALALLVGPWPIGSITLGRRE